MPNDRPVALITGATRGIGLGVAKCLAREGYDIAANGVREQAAAESALAELRELGADVLYCRADVGDSAERATMLGAVDRHFGRLNVLVNNAGVGPKVRADILEATEESYEWVMKTNLQGPYFLTQAVANWMIRQRKAEPSFSAFIVNISSVSATLASVHRGEYCLSKAGVSMATSLWAIRLGEFGIPVHEVRPGLVKSDMSKPATEKYDKLIAGGLTVEPRWGMPEDVGKVVAAIVRGDIPYGTGGVIMVDGGLTLGRL
ncbi:MAG: 3-ketoacyl-ACP reductase [Patescibacteria group bacterium]|nr:3-ketoacyl-ACP reductase [Patescibacteria group bacterium]